MLPWRSSNPPPSAVRSILGFLFVGAFQLFAEIVELFLMTFLQSLFVGFMLHVDQFDFLLHLLQVLLAPSHRLRLQQAHNV